MRKRYFAQIVQALNARQMQTLLEISKVKFNKLSFSCETSSHLFIDFSFSKCKFNEIFAVDIADIKRVAAGGEGDFPTSSTKGKKNSNVRGVTLEVGDKPDLYHLVTSDEQTINAWCDVINSLIGNTFFLCMCVFLLSKISHLIEHFYLFLYLCVFFF